MIRTTDTIIIGAGQAGLATSRHLSDLGIDHLVLERGTVGERWRSERWNSLRLLTPNWMTRLPGFDYQGADTHGFMHKDAVADHLDAYGRSFAAPVLGGVDVTSVAQDDGRFRVDTNHGSWRARAVVIATGACDTPFVPAFAKRLDPRVAQETPYSYKSPEQIANGGVMIVGASATGVQLADELARAGHDVTLSVGSHVRVPRRYRGCDLMYWLDRSGILDEPRASTTDIDALLRHPSLQLVGAADGRNIDLGTLQARGVGIVGRVNVGSGMRLGVASSPAQAVAAAETRQQRLLARIDQYIEDSGTPAPEPRRVDPIRLEPSPTELDLGSRGIRTVLWATGYRRAYPWLNLPVLTPSGEIWQDGGATALPGLYTVGLPFMRHRNSSFLGGVGRDAKAISNMIFNHLSAQTAQVA